MADHGEVEYATAEGNDYAAHEQTYENFIKIGESRHDDRRDHPCRNGVFPDLSRFPYQIGSQLAAPTRQPSEES